MHEVTPLPSEPTWLDADFEIELNKITVSTSANAS